MTTKQKAISLAEKLDVSLFKDGYGKIQADAPRGFCFDKELHVLVCDGYSDVYHRLMQYGVHECKSSYCDSCHDSDRKTAEQYADWMGWELIFGSEKF